MVRKLPVFLLLLALTTAPAPVVPGDPSPEAEAEIGLILAKEELTMADLFRLAELTNPTLAAARSGVQAKAGMAQQAGLYPNPTIGFDVAELYTDDPSDRKDKLSLVQPLILSGRRGAAVAAGRAGQEAAGFALAGTRREIFRRIHTLCTDQFYFREANAAFDDLLQVANHTLEIARIRFEARAAPESQVTKALLEVYEVEIAQRQALQEQEVGLAELLSLFWGVEVPMDRLAGQLETGNNAPGDVAHPDVLDDHPAFQSAQLEIEAAEAVLRETKAARIPDLDIYVAYGRNRYIDEGFVEAGVALPLPVFNRNQGRVAESQSEIAQAQDRARMVSSTLKANLAAAHQRFLAARDQLQATESRILPAAERGLDQTQEGYRVGHLPFLELLDAQRTLSTVRLKALELRRDMIVAEANLMSLMGAGPYADEGEKP